MSRIKKQDNIMAAFLHGDRLTVVTCRVRYGTTELRRVVNRINKKLSSLNYAGTVAGEYLNGADYKTYRLIKIGEPVELFS